MPPKHASETPTSRDVQESLESGLPAFSTVLYWRSKQMRKTLFTFLVGCLLAAVSMAVPETNLTAQGQTKLRSATTPIPQPQIKPSRLMEDLRNHRQTHPNITMKQLADFGNERIKIKGFNYDFEMCEIIKANQRPKMLRSDYPVSRLYSYRLTLTTGEKQRFQIVTDETDPLCGECVLSIPCQSVSKSEFTVIASGRKYPVKRAASYTLNKIFLMDKGMGKVLRSWETPFQTDPVGVSEDGLKLYLPTDIEELVLEVSSSGVQLRAKSQLKLQHEGEWLENHPVDPKDDSISFMRFRSGKKSFIIRFSAPDCC
jgi:hypothetical protein